ncbi:helix-turn-helix domain-containing protein [Leptothermofonsia sp. ETS-13]|uniref:helix-turn-helix domain-containing protein n=1 Tax=Leptothermofonsia sp. ETS-13 TaxID=3035696 RepID=UPI003B9F8D54
MERLYYSCRQVAQEISFEGGVGASLPARGGTSAPCPKPGGYSYSVANTSTARRKWAYPEGVGVGELSLMPGPALPALIVSESERRELEQLVKRPSTPQQLALRAQIILRASQGDSQGQIARELGIGEQMSRCWRRCWQALQTCELPVSERLADAPRPGAPATFTLEQITQLYALACTPPEHSGRPISHWTLQS